MVVFGVSQILLWTPNSPAAPVPRWQSCVVSLPTVYSSSKWKSVRTRARSSSARAPQCAQRSAMAARLRAVDGLGMNKL